MTSSRTILFMWTLTALSAFLAFLASLMTVVQPWRDRSTLFDPTCTTSESRRSICVAQCSCREDQDPYVYDSGIVVAIGVGVLGLWFLACLAMVAFATLLVRNGIGCACCHSDKVGYLWISSLPIFGAIGGIFVMIGWILLGVQTLQKYVELGPGFNWNWGVLACLLFGIPVNLIAALQTRGSQ